MFHKIFTMLKNEIIQLIKKKNTNKLSGLRQIKEDFSKLSLRLHHFHH